MRANGSCGVYLAQPTFEVSVFLHHALECLPSAPGDGIGFAKSLAISHRCSYTRIRFTDCLPIAKVPGLELLDGDAIDKLALGTASNSSRPQPGPLGYVFQLGLERPTVVVIAVHDDQYAPIPRQPCCIRP